MATDFTYNGKTITTSGGIKPSGKNTPTDIRTRVNLKADISSIPSPFVGMHIVVLQDETNSNKMTEYVVKSLKANSLGIADTVINEVVTLKEFLEVQEGTGTGIKGDKGDTGATPNITIGTVTTLQAGQQATVTKRGTLENPIFDFGIPKGADGVGGSNSQINISKAIFSNNNPHASNPLDIKTYEGGKDQPMHPKVLYFENGWNGYKYWMAYTPLPNEDNENPCIAVSNDMFTWTVPEGLENPLAFKPPTGGYNSDTHLVYRADTNVLECWYRRIYTGVQKEEFFRRTSTNGVIWTAEESCFVTEGSITQNLSPALIFEDGKYKMWTYASSPTFKYWESFNGKEWSKIKDITLQGGNWWHGDVIRTANGYEMLLYVNSGGRLYYTTSVDNTNYSTPKLILEPTGNSADWDSQNLYRSSLLIKDGMYYIFYSGQKMSTMEWKTGLTRGTTPLELHGLESVKKLTIEEAIIDLYNSVGLNVGTGGNTGTGKPGTGEDGDEGPDLGGGEDNVTPDSGNTVTDKLIMHLDARDGSGSDTIWKDRTDNGNDFTLNNFSGSYWIGSSLKFNGISNYCSANTPTQIKGLTGTQPKEISFCVNFKINSLSGQQDIFGIKNGNQSRFLILNDKIQFQMRSLLTPTTPSTFKVGETYDCVFTYYYTDSVSPVIRRYRLYINGELAYEFADNSHTPYDASNLNLLLGSENGTSAFANMNLNSVKIYSKELTQEEVLQNYNYEKSVSRA